jgi:hypothetical protein
LRTFETADSVDKVELFYMKHLDMELVALPGLLTPAASVDSIGNLVVVVSEDSFQPAGIDQRKMTIVVGSRRSPASAVSVVLSHVEGKRHTHIVINFSKR